MVIVIIPLELHNMKENMYQIYSHITAKKWGFFPCVTFYGLILEK